LKTERKEIFLLNRMKRLEIGEHFLLQGFLLYKGLTITTNLPFSYPSSLIYVSLAPTNPLVF